MPLPQLQRVASTVFFVALTAGVLVVGFGLPLDLAALPPVERPTEPPPPPPEEEPRKEELDPFSTAPDDADRWVDPADDWEEVAAPGVRDVERPRPAIELPSGRVREAPDGGEWIVHRAAPLETVEQIAHRYGVHPRHLRHWNALPEDLEMPQPGDRLRVRAEKIPPPRVKFTYEVGPGDSWWSVGTAFGVDSHRLRWWNYDVPQQLQAGQTLDLWLDPVVFEWLMTAGAPEPGEIRPGAVSVGPPQDGELVNGVRIPESPYYELKFPSAYGTTHAVEALMEAIVRFEARSDYGDPLVFGSMSRRHGGPLPGHRSHQTGRDLDIRLPLRERFPTSAAVEPDRVDWGALWHLITAFSETREVLIVFLDYELQGRVYRAAERVGATPEELDVLLQWPRGSAARLGLVRHSPGHRKHLHVRFTCGPREPECVQLGEVHEDLLE